MLINNGAMKYLAAENKFFAHCSLKNGTNEPILLVLKVNVFINDNCFPTNMFHAFPADMFQAFSLSD